MTQPFGSIVRILILTFVFGSAVGLFIWRGVMSREHHLRSEIARMEQIMAEEVAVRDAMINRLSRTSRLARVEVLNQTTDPAGTILTTTVRFIELDDEGSELGRRTFEIPGEVLFVDAWTVRFDTEHVAQGDPFAGQSLVLFRRIYSDQLQPRHGFPIDTPGGIPEGYAVTQEARAERALWRRFWDIATNAQLAESMGVRVAQGEAIYKPVESGQSFDLVAEAAGGLTLVPLDPSASLEQVASAPTQP